ncbi:MAG: SprT family zinc-dependent metalloprotease [Rhodocyclaceae bacterium]|nr:SprT family zinc-dependent metalloprotease [Rhodocyclaceae bacterium]MDZ4216200.1 SprT family zinc-dependent metalloprotease [Rhodocyclaceae bacterium]
MPEQFELFHAPSSLDTPPPNRHLVLHGRIVAYALRRNRRRLALHIDERGLRVGAPRVFPLADIEAFIQTHADWVVRKLDEFSNRTAPRHLPLHDGAELPVLGETVRVCVTAGGNRGYWKKGELWLAARPAADLAALARRALQRRALEVFQPRIAAAAAQLGVTTPALALSSARTRWGSCSTHSGIRLNWRLIHLPLPLVDYVVAHEVAHLVEMNHSPRFWAQVARLCPDWRSARAQLKQQGAALPLI